MSKSQSGCQNSGVCSLVADDSSSVKADGFGEIMLFGVRVKVDPMRKSVSMNDLSQYVQPTTHDRSSNNNNHAVAADSGYASADDVVRNQPNGCRERKRGVPWTEEEHKLFLLGLQKVGKGGWRGISRNYVKSRTPTQVASHAQKYFLRRSNLNRRRRRSSLFDITTDSVGAIPMEEEEGQEDNKGQPVLSSHQISPLSGFPILSPAQTENQKETQTSNNGEQLNTGSTLVRPIPLLPTPNPSTRADLNSNQKHETDLLSLSLNLSLSYDHDRSSLSSAFPGISSFYNGDGRIIMA